MSAINGNGTSQIMISYLLPEDKNAIEQLEVERIVQRAIVDTLANLSNQGVIKKWIVGDNDLIHPNIVKKYEELIKE